MLCLENELQMNIPFLLTWQKTPQLNSLIVNRNTRRASTPGWFMGNLSNRSLFFGETQKNQPKANLVVLPNLLPQQDIDDLIHFFRNRDKTKYNYRDHNGIRVETSFLTGNIETKNGVVETVNWFREKGLSLADAQKAILNRLIQQFTQNVHQHIETLPDKIHTVVAVPMEYTFKAGQKVAQTLGWHQDSFIRYLGILGVFQDPRIKGAQLELRSLSEKDKIQTKETLSNQMLAFHNINAEHQVSGAEVDNTDTEVPAYRNILTVGFKQKAEPPVS